MTKRIEATVFGRVQGVNFRAYTQREAIRLSLKGWVANDSDGSVRVVAEGDEDHLKELLAFLHSGSPSAKTDRVNVIWGTATHEFKQFSVRWL